MRRRRAFVLALAAVAACDGSDLPSVPDADPPDSGVCGDRTFNVEPQGSPHVAQDEPVVYAFNPPSSGPHDPRWARWQGVYEDPPMRREHWVHNLEHGGVVFLYRCPTGCPEVVDGLRQVQASLPQDARCEGGIVARSLITADPLLPAGVEIAAVSWGHVYTASCLDPVTLRNFALERAARGPEDTCAQGQVPVVAP